MELRRNGQSPSQLASEAVCLYNSPQIGSASQAGCTVHHHSEQLAYPRGRPPMVEIASLECPLEW